MTQDLGVEAKLTCFFRLSGGAHSAWRLAVVPFSSLSFSPRETCPCRTGTRLLQFVSIKVCRLLDTVPPPFLYPPARVDLCMARTAGPNWAIMRVFEVSTLRSAAILGSPFSAAFVPNFPLSTVSFSSSPSFFRQLEISLIAHCTVVERG